MDTTAFKQRMQNLKSYRENNPGKGYWDWRNSLPDNLKNTDDSEYDMRAAYESGAQPQWNEEDKSYHLPTRDPRSGLILKKSTHSTFWKGLTEDAKLGYDAYFLNDKTYTKSKDEWPINAFAGGGVNDNLVGSYSNHTGTPTMYVPVTKEYEATPDGFGEIANVHTPEVVITPQNNISLVEAVDKGRRDAAPYVGAIIAGAALPAMASTGGLGTAMDLAGVITDPLDPTNYLGFNTIKGLKTLPVILSNATESFADGGQTGDPDMEKFYQATGRSRSGRPLEEGLEPAVNLRDIVDFTPVGDALAAKDTYDAVKNKDWLGAGISAVAMLPFIPTVNKRLVSDAIDRMTTKAHKEAKMAARLNNETYELVQRLTDDPSYIRRAERVKSKYGDDYTQIYADLINAYNTNPQLLPKVKATEFTDNARAKMATTIESTARHKAGGEFPKLGEYEYQFDSNRGVPYGTTVHENNHLADFLSNKTPDAGGNSNMYYHMKSALKPYSDKLSRYYGNPSEQKAYMNQLREFMYANKMIDTRDQQVSRELIEEALNKLPKGMKSVKDATKSWKSMRSYTKWFNTIPLLGVGLIGANNYFNNTKE